MRHENEALTVGLLWHSANSGNLGVGALTQANLAILRDAAARAGVAVRFKVLGWLDRDLEVYVAGTDVEIVALSGRSFRPFGELAQHLGACDLVVDIGAGDSFADIYGGRRFAFMAISKAYALMARRPLVLAPQTIGPFDNPGNRQVAAGLMRGAAAVFTRDRLSTDYARRLGVREVQESTDVAFKLPSDTAMAPPAAPGKVKVGLNVSGLLYAGGYDRANQFGLSLDYRAFTDRLIARLAERPEVELHLVPHVLAPGSAVEDDAAVAQALAQDVPAAVVAPRFASPSAAKGYIGGLDFFLGARMHSCIAALSSGVPVAPLAYSRKFAGLFGSLGYEETVDLKRLDIDAALARALDAFERRAELAERAAAARQAAVTRLAVYEGALQAMLAERGSPHGRLAA